MASTNKTANLGLNQWVESDPFLREDANADNSRIDAETKRLQAQLDAAPYVKLFDVTTTADARQVDLDVSGIDFSKYAMVQLFSNAVSRKIDSSNNSSQNIRMQINGGGGRRTLSGNSGNEIEENYVALYERLDSGPVSIRADIFGFQIHPDVIKDTHRLALSIRSIGAMVNSSSSSYCTKYMHDHSEFVRINFLTDNASFIIKAGSRFVIYGVKL